MRIILNANYSHKLNSEVKNQEKVTNSKILKEAFIKSLKQKGEYENSKIVWRDDENVEVSGVSALALHSFVLEAEKLGKNISFEKKTIIQIAD